MLTRKRALRKMNVSEKPSNIVRGGSASITLRPNPIFCIMIGLIICGLTWIDYVVVHKIRNYIYSNDQVSLVAILIITIIIALVVVAFLRLIGVRVILGDEQISQKYPFQKMRTLHLSSIERVRKTVPYKGSRDLVLVSKDVTQRSIRIPLSIFSSADQNKLDEFVGKKIVVEDQRQF
jgi:hypothetical protein